MFSADHCHFLLTLAREAIYTAVTENKVITPSIVEVELRQPLGAFTTLTRFGALRGCIGFPEPVFPLYEAIIRGGISAALQDPRFPPVSRGELEDISIEISVLSPLQETTAEDVQVGVHGLVIEKGHARGLLLPQVPVEWGWNREEFLAHTCRKAGLPTNAWQTGATVYTFSAQVFSEAEFAPQADEPMEG